MNSPEMQPIPSGIDWDKVLCGSSHLKYPLLHCKEVGRVTPEGYEYNHDNIESILEHYEPFAELIEADPELQDIFSGLPKEFIPSAITSSTVYRYDPEPSVVGRLLGNKTAQIISATTASLGSYSEDFGFGWFREAGVDQFMAHPETPEKGKYNLVQKAVEYCHVIPDEITSDLEQYHPYLVDPLIQAWARSGWRQPTLQQTDLMRRLKFFDLQKGGVSNILQLSGRHEDHVSHFTEEFNKERLVAGDDAVFTAYQNEFGSKYPSIDVYKHIKSIINDIGSVVDNVDPEALSKVLREHCSDIGKRIIGAAGKPVELMEIIDESPLAFEVARQHLRWNGESEWGESTEEALREVIGSLKHCKPKHLESVYPPSGVVSVVRLEKNSSVFTNEMGDRLVALMNSHSRAAAYRWKWKGGSDLEKRQHLVMNDILEELKILKEKARSQSPVSDEESQLIDFQVRQLEELQSYDFSRFPHGIAELAKYKGRIGGQLTSLLLDGVPYDRRAYEAALEGSTGTLSKIIEYIQHRGIAQLFTDNPDLSKADKKAIRKLLSTKAFEPLFEARKTDGTIDMQFVPTRGLLMEASGHMSDSCWADKSITFEHPNFDALVFVQKGEGTGENDAKEKFVGASLLIKTEDTRTGQKLLVVRGLNPLLTFIGRVDIEDFFAKFEDYIKKIAAEDGRQAAIVIDEQVGRAATNRPELFRYLQYYGGYKPVGGAPLEVPSGETTFNGYDISIDCWPLH